MNAFDLLAEPVRKYIYDRRWHELRPIQAAAIQKIISDDRNYILVSPTASGKTEAAFLPILSKVDLHQPGVCVLYISPLIALINDQFIRIDDLCKYLDIPVTRWHGEANRTDKTRLIANPAGVLLITPESIEALLINKPAAARRLFDSIQYVIIDEIHSFLGADRGVQLRSLLSRLRDLHHGAFPIVGLSATLGDYEPAKAFTGDPAGTTILRDPATRPTEAVFRYFEGGDAELPLPLLKDLYREVHDHKALIFPNTRGRTEEVAVKLKKIAQRVGEHENYYSHHSSVDREVREFVEQFAKHSISNPFAIACTSTLELGIDIGAVDLVAQIDATFSIASLIQRVGRSGRRGGTSRLLFYATEPWSLLQALACLLLFNEGFIEPITPGEEPYDLLLHQLLSIVKQRSGVDRHELLTTLTRNSAFATIPRQTTDQLITHLVGNGILEQLQQELIIGIDGEPIVNNREFYSVFITEELFRVVHGNHKIGEIPYSTQVMPDENILLAARMWKIIAVDQKTKRIDVQPANDGKKPAFTGGGGKVHPRIRKKMLEILLATNTYPWLDEPAAICIQTLRNDFTSFHPIINTFRPLLETSTGCHAYTFSGTAINRTLSLLLNHHKVPHQLIERESLLDIQVPPKDFIPVWSKLHENISDPEPIIHKQLENNPALLSFSKWGIYLPFDLQVKILKERYFDFANTQSHLNTVLWQILPLTV